MQLLAGANNMLPPVLPHEREFFINRIWSGYTYVDLNGVRLKIVDPIPDIKYQAEEIYYQTYSDAVSAGIFNSDDILRILIRDGQWTEEDDNRYNNVLPTHIEHWKMQMYKTANMPSQLAINRKYLNEARNQYNRLAERRNMFGFATCAGVANYAKWQYIISKCTRYQKKSIKDSVDMHKLMNVYHSTRFNETMLRYLSRNSPWSTIVAAGKYTGSIINKPSIELTEEQLVLLSWSITYDNIRKSPDCPTEFVIGDDDLLDGWLLILDKERKAEKSEKQKNSLFSEKVGKHNEVLIMAKSAEHANEILSMNDEIAEATRQSRMKQLKDAGTLRDGDFYDVAKDLQIRKNRLFAEKLKKGNKK